MPFPSVAWSKLAGRSLCTENLTLETKSSDMARKGKAAQPPFLKLASWPLPNQSATESAEKFGVEGGFGWAKGTGRVGRAL